MSFDLSQAKICINCEFVFGQMLYKCPRCQSDKVFALTKWFKSARTAGDKELLEHLYKLNLYINNHIKELESRLEKDLSE